jgi:teneurin
VSIGYEGKNCKDIIWVYQVVKMKGRDVPVSDVGAWDLSVHHRYNTEASILHRGDGSNVYFSEGVLDVQPVVGTGQLRPVICKDDCAVTSTKTADLLAPVALAAAPDGSLYIGDFNLIRRVKPDGNMISIIQLP